MNPVKKLNLWGQSMGFDDVYVGEATICIDLIIISSVILNAPNNVLHYYITTLQVLQYQMVNFIGFTLGLHTCLSDHFWLSAAYRIAHVRLHTSTVTLTIPR